MSTLLTSRRLRWAVPGAVAAAVAVASLSPSVTASASGRPKLPTRTAAQLLVNLQEAKTPELSGTVVETTHLGLPDLSGLTGPAGGGNADLSLQNFVSGSHTLRVFYGGPDKQRVALLGTLSESDVVHNGTDLWTYSSSTHEVKHATLKYGDEKAEQVAPTVAGMTPMAAAQKALAAIDPSTAVAIDNTAYVAGRASYQVLLTPKDGRSLIGSVRIALDSATSMPLRVQVFAKGASNPAIQVGFTDVTFGAPNASVFHFIKPAGTTVQPLDVPLVAVKDTTGAQAEIRAKAKEGLPTKLRAPVGANTGSKVIGSGWTAVVETSMPYAIPAGGPNGPATPSDAPPVQVRSSVGSLLDKASTPVAGGRVVTSALLTILITDDGKVFVGPVSAADLQKVASTGKGL